MVERVVALGEFGRVVSVSVGAPGTVSVPLAKISGPGAAGAVLELGSWVAFWSGLEVDGWTALFWSDVGAGACPTAAPRVPNIAALPNSAAVINASRI